MPSLPFRNKNLDIAATNYTEADTNSFWSCPNLLDFVTLFHCFFQDYSYLLSPPLKAGVIQATLSLSGIKTPASKQLRKPQCHSMAPMQFLL